MTEKPKLHPSLRALAALLILGSLGMIFAPWVGTGLSFSGLLRGLFLSAESVGLAQLCRGEGNLAILIAAGLLLICACLGLVCALRGIASGGIPVFLASLFALCVVSRSLRWDREQLGPGAWLCLGLAAGAMLLLPAPSLIRAAAARRQARRAKKGEPAPSCPACGEPLPDKVRFCPNCGNPCGAEVLAVPPCSACGAQLRPGMAFCPACGAPTLRPEPPADGPARFCPECGTELREGAFFCPECGTPVRPAEP